MSATFGKDTKGKWYLTGVLSEYNTCERRLPMEVKVK